MSIPNDMIDSAFKRRLRSAVLKWYDKHGRQLPWRSSADPYRVWLSEIMLQQTTVAAVVPYFERFVARFPDVKSLASADVDDVLRLWEGLGYYSRARNLHKAAKVIVNQHDGVFPSDVGVLKTLSGIGRYTAGAIVSFAFDLPAAIVEANTERLFARLIALRDDVRSTPSRSTLWEFAESLVPNKRCGDFNQALMDIGSQVCRPVAPVCSKCPLMSYCSAFELGLQNELPVRKPRTPITVVTEVCIVIRRGDKVLLRRRGEGERWAGMWDFIRFEVDAAESRSFLPERTCQSRSLLPERTCQSRCFLPERTSADGGPARDVNVEQSWIGQPAAQVAASREVLPGRQDLQKLLPGRQDLQKLLPGRQDLQKLLPGRQDLKEESLPSIVGDRVREQTGLSPGSIADSTEFIYSVTRYRVLLKCFLCGTMSPKVKLTAGQEWFGLAELADLPMSKSGRLVADWVKLRTSGS